MKIGLFSKKTILIIILIIIYLLWNERILDAFDEIFVKPILSKIENNGKNFILFFFLYELTTFYFLYWCTLHKKIRSELLLLSTFILINYLWFRLFEKDRYTYTPFYGSPISYADYFVYLFVGIIILRIIEFFNHKSKPSNPDVPFLVDKPWQHGATDLFGRSQFAKALADKIQSELPEEDAGSLAIGINGVWGSGKTSFLNKIRSFIEMEGRIVIQFNPWRSSSPNKIIEDFFELLIDELSPYAPHLSNKILKYAKSITKIDENVFTKSLDNVNEFLFEEKSQNERYDEINEAIERLEKQIIIFIDDLDRLDKKEIVEVLRLIRNTADFNKVVYIVAYDRSYVLEAIKDFNPNNYLYFLEKIFQFEFALTKFDNEVLRQELKKGLNKLNEQDLHLVIKAIDRTKARGEYITDWFITSQRDVIRFLNAFLFEIENIKTEVNFADFYYLQLLKLKYPFIHQSIFQYKKYFFYRDNDGTLKFRTEKQKDLDESLFELFGIRNDQEQNNDNNETQVIFFSKFIEKIDTLQSLNEVEKEKIILTVQELITVKNYDDVSKLQAYKGFVYDNNFTKYFSYQLLSSDLPAGRFEEVRREEFPVYQTEIDNWINEGRINQIVDRLEKIEVFQTFKEWENQLRILIHIGKYFFKLYGTYNGRHKEIIELLNYPKRNDGIVFFVDEDAYIDYIRNLFLTAPDPYLFESNLLAASLTRVVSFPLSDSEVHTQLLKYFKDYCRDHKEITSDFRHLYNNCLRKREGYFDTYDTLPEAENLFKSHFLTYLKGSELGGFIIQTEFEMELFHITKDWLQTFFHTWEDLEIYLQTANNIMIEKDSYDEFVSFYEKYKRNNYKPIEFHFQYLKPSRIDGR